MPNTNLMGSHAMNCDIQISVERFEKKYDAKQVPYKSNKTKKAISLFKREVITRICLEILAPYFLQTKYSTEKSMTLSVSREENI